MAFVLDTNIVIHLMDDDDPEVADATAALNGARRMSVVTRIEIEGGLAKEDDSLRRRRFAAVTKAMEVLPFGGREADAYRSILESTGFSRRKILDRMIAAQALAQGFTLVTRNGDDFRDIPGLILLEV